MHIELHEFVTSELETISSRLQSELLPSPVIPRQLYHLTDAAGVVLVIRDGTLQARHSRLGWCDSVVPYGVSLVREFLNDRLHLTADRLSGEFCKATLTNFNPHGTHFDCFLARLFEDDGSNRWSSSDFPGYALGFRTADMPIKSAENESGATIRLLQAIYSREVQLDIIRRLYTSYEAYYADAVRRFGEKIKSALLPECWDRFRRDVGEFLVRFRSPALSHEKEWIAIALKTEGQGSDRVDFDIIDNRFVPYVALDITTRSKTNMPKLALDTIVFGIWLPLEVTQESLRAFLHECIPPKKVVGNVNIRQANILPA